VLRRAVSLVVGFIDTANAYGPNVSEELILEALFPYAKGLVIATNVGSRGPRLDQWTPNGNPAHVRAECEGSPKRLCLEQVHLPQLHRIDPKVNLHDQFDLSKHVVDEGNVRQIGASEVSVAEIETARKIVPIVSVYPTPDRQDHLRETIARHGRRRRADHRRPERHRRGRRPRRRRVRGRSSR
jgi:aryl-alcohol dehydrogenase-like predicted oxidoreductase